MSQPKNIYVVESDNGELKVGISTNPQQRIKQLSTGHPHDLSLARSVGPLENAKQVEESIHAQFNQYNISGEWFNADCYDELLAFVDGIATATVAGGESPLSLVRDISYWHYEWTKENRKRERSRDFSIQILCDYLVEKFGIESVHCQSCEHLVWPYEDGIAPENLTECAYCGAEL